MTPDTTTPVTANAATFTISELHSIVAGLRLAPSDVIGPTLRDLIGDFKTWTTTHSEPGDDPADAVAYYIEFGANLSESTLTTIAVENSWLEPIHAARPANNDSRPDQPHTARTADARSAATQHAVARVLEVVGRVILRSPEVTS